MSPTRRLKSITLGTRKRYVFCVNQEYIYTKSRKSMCKLSLLLRFRFILCFGVECVCCLYLMYVFIFLFKFGKPSGRLMGNICSLGSIYFLCISHSNCQYSFSHLDFWSAYFFLIAPFPDRCLLVPYFRIIF